MNNCEKCDHDFEKGGNFNFHKEALHKNNWSLYFDAVRDIESKFRCEMCETKFKTEKELNEHKIAVWCEGCMIFWNCGGHKQRSKCTKCVENLRCKEKCEAHWHQKHKLTSVLTTKASKIKETSEEKEYNFKDSTEATINSAATISLQPETLIDEDYENKKNKGDDEYDDTEEEEVKAEGDDTDTKESDDIDLKEEEVKAEGDDTDTEKSDDTDAEEDEAMYKVKLDPEVYERRTVDDPAVKITRATESVEGKPTTVIASSYSTVETIKKTHHESLEIIGSKNDDSITPNRMILQQIGTCENDLWTTTSIMITNLHQQLSQLNLCIISLGCFAFKNTPKTIKLCDLTDDPSNTLIDISEYGESKYEINSDQVVYNDKTGDDPIVKVTETTNDDEEGPVTLKSSSYKRANTSRHDKSMYKIKTDLEVYTIDDPAVEITGAAEGIEEETERVNTSRYNKTDSMKTHHKSLN